MGCGSSSTTLNAYNSKLDLPSSNLELQRSSSDGVISVIIPNQFESNYKLGTEIDGNKYRKIFNAIDKKKKKFIVEVTSIDLMQAGKFSDVEYFTRLDSLRQFDCDVLPKCVDFFDVDRKYTIVFENFGGYTLDYFVKKKLSERVSKNIIAYLINSNYYRIYYISRGMFAMH
jgi:hypothetical protein